VAWELAPDQLFTMLGIVFFSIIHVPVNVPALSVLTGDDADLNSELKVQEPPHTPSQDHH
jgi:MFS superfamily sulfate permease-like transporter